MKVSEINYDDLTQDVVDKILFEGIEDNQLCGDCIMVLGSASAYKYRLPKAVELYKQKRARKILVSGGTTDGAEPEAHRMVKYLTEAGVPPEDIFAEDISTSTAENFICSLYVLHQKIKITTVKELLLVTTRFHMRRSLMTAESFMPKWIKVYPCPADDTNTLRHNWFLHEKNNKMAKDEAYKISCYIREGCIDDFEI